MKKLVLAIAIVAVLAMAFTSVGYAYTASTENSGNSVTSQYVTLTQQNYTFNGYAVSFDVVETEAGIKYQLNGHTEELMDIEGRGYVGALIGSDKLSATMTGGTGGVLGVAVTSPQMNDGWFTDYSGDLYGWRYVLKASVDCNVTGSVTAINAMGSPAVGACYRLTDSGTLTKGSLAVAAGDVVGYDGSAWVLMPDQYAYYSGSSNGMWVVKGQNLDSQYRVAAVDADPGGYIKLYSADTIKDITVVVITHNAQGVASVHHVYVNEGFYTPIDLGVSPSGKWYVDGREITDGKYTVEKADADAGCNVVIYDAPTAAGTFDVVKIDNGTATLVSGKTAGQTVDGMYGWNVGGGIKLHILTGATYTTKLYFAGESEYVNSALRSEGSVIKATGQVTIVPEWVPAGASDKLKYTLKASDSEGAEARAVFVQSGSDVMLPDNCFEAPANMKFVGWKADNMSKVFTSGHIFTSYSVERTFTAQWAAEEDCFAVTFNSGGGYGTMATAYLLKNLESGNTYTLPPCGFTKPDSTAVGWMVVGATSGTHYTDYGEKFTDIAGVKEGLILTPVWGESPVGGEHVTISFDTKTVVVIPHTGSPYVVSGKEIGDTIELEQGIWYIRGRSLGNVDSYVLRDPDVVQGGYAVLYQDQNASGQYKVIRVEGNWVDVSGTLSVDDHVDHVGDFRVNGAAIYGGLYVVNVEDADDAASRFIVLYEFTNPSGEYTVITVSDTGNPTMTKGLRSGDSMTLAEGTWYVKGVSKEDTYTVNPSDAVNGFIVLYKTANESNKYTVVKASINGATAIRNLTVGDIEHAVTGVKGWKVKGWEIGSYKVRAEDAAALGSDGYILLYSNVAATYLYHTGENGSYTLPACYSAPPEDPAMIGFKGWKLLGWEVTGSPGRFAGQSYTMPIGTDGYIVKNGTIKFSYSNDLHNGEAA